MAIIVIDYDDTIVFQDYPRSGAIKPGAKDVINRLHSEGHKILIWTCRAGDRKEIAADYLTKEGVLFHTINENLDEVCAMYGGDTRKLSGDIYIDDKQLGGIPDDWELIYKIIKKQLIWQSSL